MRILSQDGLHEGIIDVPYEQVSIEQKQNEIWAGYSFTMQEHCVGKCFAKYSTAEKAQKAMKLLHEKYKKYNHYLCDIDDFVPPKLFQFPSDDETKVEQ